MFAVLIRPRGAPEREAPGALLAGFRAGGADPEVGRDGWALRGLVRGFGGRLYSVDAFTGPVRGGGGGFAVRFVGVEFGGAVGGGGYLDLGGAPCNDDRGGPPK